MDEKLHKIEVVIDKIIPFLLVALLFVIVIEIWFSWFANRYHYWFDAFDIFVVSVFMLDLFFKYQRVKNIKNFVREYWIDIIAVLPFFLVFRILEIFRASELLEGSQKILHEGVVIERETRVIVREAEEVAKVSRTERFLRYFRVTGRFPRFLRATPFFEHPTGKHYVRKNKA